MIHRFESFPGEIWDLILTFIPSNQLQSTVSALISILPNSNISIDHLYKHIIISSDQEIKNLIIDPQNSSITQSFTLEAWKLIDYFILINQINWVSSNLRIIHLNIGPFFAPEHLEELFLKPKLKLELLSLRFNQNVLKRTYEPFLKGAYFDSALDLLSKWPGSVTFRSLSLVQDLPPPYEKSKSFNDGIAQPIILFRFNCVINLATSPLARHLRNLRLRIPNRNLVLPLTNNSSHLYTIPIGSAELNLPIPLFPSLKLLDLSTSLFSSITNLTTILKQYPSLQHLIIDHTQLLVPCRFEGDEERVNGVIQSIANAVASAGVSRQIDLFRHWLEFQRLFRTELEQELSRQTAPNESNDNRQEVSSRVMTLKRRGRSAYASPPKWKFNSIEAGSSSGSSVKMQSHTQMTGHLLKPQAIPQKLVIVPRPSEFLSLCCGTELVQETTKQTRQDWKDQFESGWIVGVKRYEQVVVEKMREYTDSIERWDRSFGQKAIQNALHGRPRLMQERFLEERQDPDKEIDNIFEGWAKLIGLADVNVDEIKEQLNKFKTKKPIIFCTIPDCFATGKVAYIPAPNSKDLLNFDQSIVHLMKKLQLNDHETLPEELDHAEGCGHLIARKNWV
ncbi:hypothetical protein O181_048879 [Austropuccinia psidii MF-1]|uniref:F-box domain-containing protein n=1 Tax=Austropuccinia psidii MF-1 TaxID=1389203 RepID=A0A9Q3DTQ6_9BASI|nr:hypothetical protein [Austropuccinia psidii MF-1]